MRKHNSRYICVERRAKIKPDLRSGDSRYFNLKYMIF